MSNDTKFSKARDSVFDMIKGLLALSVIIGHSITGHLYAVIFSFHMPMFFIIAGYFFTQRSFFAELKICSKRVIRPLLFSQLIVVAIACIMWLVSDTNIVIERVLSVLWGGNSGMCVFKRNLWVGPLWFLYAYFCARLMFNLIVRIRNVLLLLCVSIFTSIIAVNLDVYGDAPFSFFASVCALSFMTVGYLIKKNDFLHKKNMLRPISIICWLAILSLHRNMDMHLGQYVGYFVFDLLGSVGAFFFFHFIADSMTKSENGTENLWIKYLTILGKYCFVVFVIHSIECIFLQDAWRLFMNKLRIYTFLGSFSQIFVVVLRLALVLSITVLVSKVKFLKERIFGIR